MMSSTVLVLLPLAAAGLSLAFLLPVVCKLYRRCNAEEITSEWLESFSPSAYYPMQSLLAEEDFRFLSRQPGFDLSLYRKLRRERLHIFRQYLSRLILDFNRLHTAARMLLAQGRDDRSDVLMRLIWLKAKFSAAVIHAEYSYVLCCIGFRSLAVRSMIVRLEEMSAQLGSLSAAQFA
jgi:hypothetical protein